MTPNQALAKLKAGNAAFVEATSSGATLHTEIDPARMASDQKPFAIILSCSDSRVPAEIVFSQGIGDLFIIRVAGNIVAPSQIGSVEFACQHFGTQLVVVMGHQRCGAISATVDSLIGDPGALSPNVAAIVDRVTPAVHPVVANNADAERDDLMHLAMRANVEHSVQGLQMRSQIIRGLIEAQQLKIVGAEYSIESGVVDFYEHV